jgi:hypothetical protein
MTVMIPYKYRLNHVGTTDIDLPSPYSSAHVAFQCGQLQLWAFVAARPLEARTRTRRFCVVQTGSAFGSSEHLYVGTAMTDDGAFVLHVFEMLEGGDS